MRALTLALALLPLAALAEGMQPVPGFDRQALLGDWFEVASTPTLLEQDCHGVTVDVAPRDDSRLTMKIACHKGRVDGPVLPIEGVMAETVPGSFSVRLVRLSEVGILDLVVLWQAEDGSMVALGSPVGAVGWVWSRTAHPEPAALKAAKAALAKNGYNPQFIADVDQGN